MSLLFLYIGNWAKNAAPDKSKCFYKLILASNRDERYSKRVLPAVFWDKPDDHILADKHVDENHGTWLGITKTGKLADCLKIKRDILNISTDEYINRMRNKRADFLISRAAIVPSFLQSAQNISMKHLPQVKDTTAKLTSAEFANILCAGSEHNCHLSRFLPFHFIGVDLNPDSPTDSVRATYLSNKCFPDINHTRRPLDITPPPGNCEFLGYGNSPIYKPLKKVVHGRLEFMELVSKYMCSEDVCEGIVIANEENKIAIKNELLVFLRSTKKYLPDPVILEYAKGDRMKEKIANRQSARFVSDFFDLATRTQTIVFVDTNNKVTFYEWLLKEPIYNPESSEWIKTVHEFTI